MSKFPTILAVAAVAVLALTACAPAGEPEAAVETPAPVVTETVTPEPTEDAEPVATPEPTPTPTLSVADCVDGPTGIIRLPADAYYPSYSDTARLDGEIFDTGARDLAAGEPTLNADGQVVSYTIQPGDTFTAIAGRFCMDSRTLAAYNHTNGHYIEAGSTLVLRPDPDEPWERQTTDEAAAASCAAGNKNGIDMDSDPPRVKGVITDFGATDGANGTVSRTDGGEIEEYTVAAGDSLAAVADRFCFDVNELAAYNSTGPTITSGDVLVLRPAPTNPGHGSSNDSRT